MVDATTLRYLMSLVISKKPKIYLMDVVIAYLYGSLDNDIYMKILKGFKLSEKYNSSLEGFYSIKL